MAKKRSLLKITLLVLLLLICAAGLFSFLSIKTFRAASSSMEPTLPRGSLMVTLPFFSSSMTLARGEIVLFKNRGRADQVFTKRIIGIPGDEVSIDGPYLVINGVAVDRAKVDETSDTTTWAEKLGKKHYEIKFLKEGQRHHTKEYSVPSDSYFVMGDNRDNSNDSRYTGFVKKEWIRAKLVSVVVLPF